MTREEYGKAYQKGYNLTVRFLVSRGLAYDAAQETAQAAWVKGWERIGQLRDQRMPELVEIRRGGSVETRRRRERADIQVAQNPRKRQR